MSRSGVNDGDQNTELRLIFVGIPFVLFFFFLYRAQHFGAAGINEWDLPPLGMHKCACFGI